MEFLNWLLSRELRAQIVYWIITIIFLGKLFRSKCLRSVLDSKCQIFLMKKSVQIADSIYTYVCQSPNRTPHVWIACANLPIYCHKKNDEIRASSKCGPQGWCKLPNVSSPCFTWWVYVVHGQKVMLSYKKAYLKNFFREQKHSVKLETQYDPFSSI